MRHLLILSLTAMLLGCPDNGKDPPPPNPPPPPSPVDTVEPGYIGPILPPPEDDD